MAETFDPVKHEYRKDGRLVLSVTQVLGITGFTYPFSDEAAMQRGTFVHDACHYYDEGDLDLDSLHPTIRGYVDGYIRFLDETGFKVTHSEVPLFSRKGFAGKFDMFGEFQNPRGLGLGDRKTGGVPYWAGLQLGGYEELIREWLEVDKPIKRFALQLFPDGAYKIHWFEDPQERRVFLGLVPGANYKKNHER